MGKLGTMGYRILCFNRHLKQLAGRRQQRGKRLPDPKVRNISLSDTETLSKFDRSAAETAIHNGYDTMICGYSHKPKKLVFENEKGK